MADSPGGLRIELLGPVEARVNGRAAMLGGERTRTLLAILALMGGRVVSADRLIDELWGEDPPARARDGLQMHVSRLRKALGADRGRLVNRAGGYLLDVRPGERDTDHWRRALAAARQARADGDPRVARSRVEEALAVWRGQPLEGVRAHSFLAAERARLEEERLAAIIDGIELDLELGRHQELLGQLDALVIGHPFKERLVELQMTALYRCGRQSEALAAFRAARARFADELGIEPAQPLRELHEAILRHAEELASPIDRSWATPRSPKPEAPGGLGLPAPPNRTIGRERELRAVADRLRTESVRLLTLTGPGGVGKTRLAVEAARAIGADFADGARFVSLAAQKRPEDVPGAIVDALGIVALAGETAAQAAERFLAAKHLVVVIDNVEHLLEAAPFLAGLLEACANLTVLATSREPLALQAEERYPVSPLALPEPGTPEDPRALAGVDAVALFCVRARARDPGFELSDANAGAVAEICRRVDGLPLAIELAAARCGLLSAREIAERLDAPAVLAAGPRDAPARQRTLRATIEWSYGLLSDRERACYGRFAVFSGGATVAAAERVTGADLDILDALVAKSMLVRRQQGRDPTRLSMLETIRAHAAEQFGAAGDAEAVRERHHRYYLDLALRHGGERALWGTAGPEHLATLDAELPNLHAACAWALDRGRAEPALELCVALGPYWLLRNRYTEALEWIDRAIAAPGAEAAAAFRTRVLCDKTWCLWALGRGGERAPVLDEAEALARGLRDPVLVSHVLGTRATYAAAAGRLELAATLADEALGCATAAGDDWAIAIAAEARALASGSTTELRERVDAAAALLEGVGNVNVLGGLLSSAAYAALRDGSDRDALELAARAIPVARELDDPYGWMLLQGNLALAKLLTGDADAAREAFRAQLRLCRELAVRPLASEGLLGLAAVAAVRGERDRAARLAGASAAHAYGARQHEIQARLDAAFLAPARDLHGADLWDAATRAGAGLGFEAAIAYALHETHARLPAARDS